MSSRPAPRQGLGSLARCSPSRRLPSLSVRRMVLAGVVLSASQFFLPPVHPQSLGSDSRISHSFRRRTGGERLSIEPRMWLVLLLVLAGLPGSVFAAEPTLAVVLDGATCVGRGGGTQEIRLTRIQFGGDEWGRGEGVTQLFAVETGDPWVCPVRRFWQLLRARAEKGLSSTRWRGRVVCSRGGGAAYLVLLEERYPQELEVSVYSADLTASVLPYRPPNEGGFEEAADVVLLPKPLSRLTLRGPKEDCYRKRFEARRRLGRLQISLRGQSDSCSPIQLTFLLGKRRFLPLVPIHGVSVTP